ncbi:MAG TPA: hypothetical protein DHV37_05930 [Erysipelotrichaceae bacterium]|nr:hypothetical protein [Erysipelotrichaceae bacterium]
MAWDFKREERKFEVLPEGQYRVRIKSADKAVSKNGNDMLVLQFEVSGSKTILYHYIVFMNDKPEITNRMLTQFFDSFKDIPEGDFNMQNWVGKVGAVKVKHEEYNGNEQAKISYFIHKDKQSDLPAWIEPDTGVKVDENGFIDAEDIGDLPF